ncbi:MAG TPA: adenylyl-sulfate kinase [Kineosporiaceae bacterium]|nr:adenylyl-sulfate kinase [Kineosporiaceae bacterium]
MSALGSVTGLPTWHPPREVLEIAELVLSGAIEAVPAPIAVPEEHAAAEGLVLEDAEGTPVAVLRRSGAEPAVVQFESLRVFTHGPVRSARRDRLQVRAELAQSAAGVLVVPVQSMLGTATVEAVLARAAASGRALLWLAVFGAGRPSALPAAGLWRAVREISEQATESGLHSVAVPVAVPLPAGTDPADDAALITAVAHAFAGTEAVEVADQPIDPAGPSAHPAFARERDRAVPPPNRRGVTVFFTGLSGSGKSTVAKAFADELAERSPRTVSLLDGDEVRRMLSAGLGFSRADRDLNIRRIGFVATEVNRHGGIAICAPIAPFAQTRAQVRADVEEVGDFVLIHISTPLAECERRDRKGLYAKARRGEIPEFTGISSPYEVPVDADLRLDTSTVNPAEAVAAVWDLLAARGYLEN